VDEQDRAGRASALLARARADSAAGRVRAAERRLREAAALGADEAGRLLDGLSARRCRALLAAGRPRDAAREVARALRGRRAPSGEGDRFLAFSQSGRYRQAFACAERLLDARAGARTAAIWNPWGWIPMELIKSRDAAALAALREDPACGAWPDYLLGLLFGYDDAQLARLAALPPARYGPLRLQIGHSLLSLGRFEEALRWLDEAPRRGAASWWAHGHAAEALVCLGRGAQAARRMRQAVAEAPSDERASALAWSGEIDLWLGRYGAARRSLDAACRSRVSLAYCWRGAVELQMGSPKRAVALLDEALRLRPDDLEAAVWRGEAKRRLRLWKESLDDLSRAPGHFWSRVNRGLVMAAVRDEDGLRAEFRELPGCVVDFIRRRARLAAPSSPARMRRVLEAALRLAKGFRREDHGQRVWVRGSDAARPKDIMAACRGSESSPSSSPPATSRRRSTR
jgi:tetratricopeptide (TPR) repeat protein